MFVTKNAVKEFMIEPIINDYVQRNNVKSDILSPFFFMCHIRFILSQKKLSLTINSKNILIVLMTVFFYIESKNINLI
jgi:hypothetical protein